MKQLLSQGIALVFEQLAMLTARCRS